MEGPQHNQESERLIAIFEEIKSVSNMEERLGIELAIIDEYISLGRPIEDIISALDVA